MNDLQFGKHSFKPNDLSSLFPHASKGFLLANRQAPAPVVERGAGDGPLAKKEVEAGHHGRFFVLVKSYRRRLLDEDNLCEKYVVDCLRYAGILSVDSPDRTTIAVSQEKVKSKAEERTEIVITPL